MATATQPAKASSVVREDFLKAIQHVAPALTPKEVTEQSDCIAFHEGNVITFSEELYCRAPSGLNKSLTGVVKGKRLVDILQKIPDDKLAVTLKDGRLTFKAEKGGRSIWLNLEAEITMPLESVEEPEKWQKIPDDMLAAIDLCAQSSAKTEDKGFDTVCLHIAPDHIEATDKRQITRFKLPTGVAESILVRSESARNAVRMGATEMAETDSWLHFRVGEVVLSCRRYLEEYKDLAKHLTFKAKAIQLPKGLKEAADAANVFTSELVDDNLIEITLKKDRLVLVGQGVTGGFKESRKLNWGGEELVFLISPEILQEVVKRHNEVLIGCDDNGNRRLRVDGGRWVYVTALGKPSSDEEPQETEEGGKEKEE